MTRCGAPAPGSENHFNSHARVGRDQVGEDKTSILIDFNSHARVGRDQVGEDMTSILIDFNSHARVGRDSVSEIASCISFISTHTPV